MEEAIFDVVVKDFKATDLKTRSRFKDKLKIVGDFDGSKFKTSKELIGGGDVAWKFNWTHQYKIYTYKWLEQKELVLKLMLSDTECYGTIKVDLYTIATGPIEHNLPVLDNYGKSVGRLNFNVEMVQISNVAVVFKEIQFRNLRSFSKDCNPYLKYGYSKHWKHISEGKQKAFYSEVLQNTQDPKWTDVPELRFTASLKELLHESIVIHVTHQGKIKNTSLGHCNLLFGSLAKSSLSDDDSIVFKGPCNKSEIEGKLYLKFLPRFAQMKAAQVIHKAIHTENGIFDAVPLLEGLPLPKLPINMTGQPSTDDCETPKTLRASLPVTTHGQVSESLFPNHEDSPAVLKKSENAAPNDLILFSPIMAHRESKKEIEQPKEDIVAQPANPFLVPTVANVAPAAPKNVNHPSAAGHYPTSYPAQYVLPHPFAQNVVLATIVAPNPFLQPAIQEPTFNPFEEGLVPN